MGDNGAGKSTLVKTIAGIHPADSGTIAFEGKEVTITTPTDAVALGIATVYQDLALCDNLDVVENLFLGREETGGGPAGVVHQLDEVGMEKQTGDLLENLAVTITSVRAEVGTMSGGQRQQVAIARSLLGEPKLVMLDEPTAALGVRQTAMVLDLVKTAARPRLRRPRDQPQPRGRVRGGRPDLSCCGSARRPATSWPGKRIRSRSLRRSPVLRGMEASDEHARGDRRRGRERSAARSSTCSGAS